MKKILIFSILSLLPFTAAAQGLTLPGIITRMHTIINFVTPLIAGLALLFFFWGLAKYILNAGDEEKKKEGKSIMIWGVIALFVMVSVWGLTTMLATTFGVPDDPNLLIPRLIPGR